MLSLGEEEAREQVGSTVDMTKGGTDDTIMRGETVGIIAKDMMNEEVDIIMTMAAAVPVLLMCKEVATTRAGLPIAQEEAHDEAERSLKKLRANRVEEAEKKEETAGKAKVNAGDGAENETKRVQGKREKSHGASNAGEEIHAGTVRGGEADLKQMMTRKRTR